MLILLSSRITDLTHNDSPFRAIVSHCGNLLSHVRAEVHDLCAPNPLCPPRDPPKNELSLCKGTLKLCPLLRELGKLSLPVEGCISPRRAAPFAQRLSKTHEIFSRRNSGQLLALSWGNVDAPQKRRFAPPWAVQSYSRGCVSPESWKAEPQVHSPAPVSHLSCPLTPTHVKKKKERNKAITPFPSQIPRKLVWVKALATWQHECKHTRASW